jgi:hypothetical protein
VRQTAGARSADLEINILIFDVVITTNRRTAATTYLGELQERLEMCTIDGELTADDLLDSPYLLFGTDEQIAEHLINVREETGASYIAVFPHLMDAFQPVLNRPPKS